jgi:hypothetical protein
MKMKKLPKQVYVAWEQAANDEPFLIAQETEHGLVEAGDTRTVGVYQLVETVTLSAKVEITRNKRRAR